jgi:hypothetical protein
MPWLKLFFYSCKRILSGSVIHISFSLFPCAIDCNNASQAKANCMNQHQNTPELQMTIPYRRVWQMNKVNKDGMLIHHECRPINPAIAVSAANAHWTSTVTKRMIWYGFLVIALLLTVSGTYAQQTSRTKLPENSGKPAIDPQNGLEVSLITPYPIIMRGKVVDHFGNGVKGAMVQVMVKGAKVSALTDADGNYTIELEGGYKYGSIQVAADDFRTTEKEVNLQDLSAIGTLVPVVTKMELLEDDLIKAIRPGMKVNGTVK